MCVDHKHILMRSMNTVHYELHNYELHRTILPVVPSSCTEDSLGALSVCPMNHHWLRGVIHVALRCGTESHAYIPATTWWQFKPKPIALSTNLFAYRKLNLQIDSHKERTLS